ncbi:hypothetical protein LSUB1_G005142 [Lachnellula subtilissima]|uniref:Xylanolytic transcriptional activator regulatory domain-containing protein n=1 Tax=Lachnellula subtilissima TaxID=602034 RepID=A0A8H8U805_9HELO|nr:hypothetical protein LSUB1_G005142 [Lachnellula subtilissima]
MTPAFSPAFSMPSPDNSPPWNEFCQSGGPTDTEDSQIGTDWDCLHFYTSEMLVGSSKNTVSGIGEDTACAGLDDSLNPDHLLLTTLPWSASPPPDECLTSFSGPTTIREQPDPNVLARVPILDPVSNFTANIIMQMLCAFPQMMLRRETLPPFIHGHWYRASTATEPALPKPLVNCTSIAQVFASQNLECKPFLWNSIKTELQVANEKTTQRESLREDLLAAIQAQLIYMMMRVIDNSNRKADLNLDTYENLCESFKELCNEPFCQDERLYPSHTWEDWIFAESRRRTVLVWVLIAQIVSIKIGVSCHICDNYREIPLPSPKGLWEARTRSCWQTENEVYKTMPRGGLESFGDLIDACKHSGIKPNKLKLNAWNTTVDNLGMLLGLGAAILGF